MKRALLWALGLLIPMALYVMGSTFGRPDPAYSPSIEQRAWLNPQTVYHPDEFAYVGKAYRMLLERDWNPHYYHNPSLNIYTNMILFWLGDAEAYPHDLDYSERAIAPFPLHSMARYMSALYTMLTVVLTYEIGRVAFNKRAGLVAAALIAVMPLMVEHAHFATPNAQTTMLSTAALLAAALVLTDRFSPHVPLGVAYGSAGLLVGLTMSARYNAVVVGIVTGLALLTAWWRDRHRWRAVLAGFVLMPAGFMIGTPGSVLATSTVIEQIRGILSWYRERGGGPGFTASYGIEALYYHMRYLVLAGPGPLAVLSALGGAWFALRHWRDNWYRAWFTAALLLYIAIYAVLALLGTRLQGNLLLPLLIPLALLAGSFTARLNGHAARSRALSTGWAALLVIWPLVLSLLLVARFTAPSNRQDAQAWIYDNIPRGTSIYLLGPYNVPIDPLDYHVRQTYGGEANAEAVRNSDAPIIVYSDAAHHTALRDPNTSRPEDLIREAAIRDVLDANWITLASFERWPWPLEDIPPDDISYWTQIGITIYCNPANCPLDHDAVVQMQ